MPRIGLPHANRLLAVTATDTTTGGDVRLTYGNVTNPATTTSFWQFNVTSTSTFNLNRVNAAGTVLSALSIDEAGAVQAVGPLRVDGTVRSNSPVVAFNSNPTSGQGVIQFALNNSPRWQITRNDLTESGGANGRTGSDFGILALDNSGANPLLALYIERETSRTTFLASGYRSGSFQSFHNQAALSASRTVIWPDLGGQVVVRSDSTAPANGEILIGNGTQFVRAAATQGTGITLTAGAGSLTIATSGNFGDQAVSRYSITNNAQSGTTYTLQASDNGLQVICSNAAAITVTVPSGLPTGFNCLITQGGAGQVTIAAGASVTLQQRQSLLKLAGQHAVCSILPTPTANTYRLTGDLVA